MCSDMFCIIWQPPFEYCTFHYNVDGSIMLTPQLSPSFSRVLLATLTVADFKLLNCFKQSPVVSNITHFSTLQLLKSIDGALSSNHITRMCCRLAGDTTDQSTTSRHVEMLQTHSLLSKYCRLAVDLLVTQGFAGDLLYRQSSSKSTENLQQIRVMWFEL